MTRNPPESEGRPPTSGGHRTSNETLLYRRGEGLVSGQASTMLQSSLVDPQKLNALAGDRAADQRLCKISYWLREARRNGHQIEAVIDQAHGLPASSNPVRLAAQKKSLLDALQTLEDLGSLNEGGLANLRRGRATIIQQGKFEAQDCEVDHILPVAIVPELRNSLFNL